MSASHDEDRLLEHDYDGIQEYDNPMPRWWLYIFWATIVCAALFWFNVPGIGIGKGRIADYDAAVAAAAAAVRRRTPQRRARRRPSCSPWQGPGRAGERQDGLHAPTASPATAPTAAASSART